LARFVIGDSSYVVLEGSDGRVLLRTALLSGQLACRSTILSIRLCSLLDECYVRSTDDQGRHSFALHVADGGDPLAFGALYSTVEERERAIAEVRHGAAQAFVTHAAHGEPDDHEDEDADAGVVVVKARKVGRSKPDGGGSPTGANDNGA
jgi:hypothetical protein